MTLYTRLQTAALALCLGLTGCAAEQQRHIPTRYEAGIALSATDGCVVQLGNGIWTTRAAYRILETLAGVDAGTVPVTIIIGDRASVHYEEPTAPCPRYILNSTAERIDNGDKILTLAELCKEWQRKEAELLEGLDKFRF